MGKGGVIVDSAMDFTGSVAGSVAPSEVIDTLCLNSVRYIGFTAACTRVSSSSIGSWRRTGYWK